MLRVFRSNSKAHQRTPTRVTVAIAHTRLGTSSVNQYMLSKPAACFDSITDGPSSIVNNKTQYAAPVQIAQQHTAVNAVDLSSHRAKTAWNHIRANQTYNSYNLVSAHWGNECMCEHLPSKPIDMPSTPPNANLPQSDDLRNVKTNSAQQTPTPSWQYRGEVPRKIAESTAQEQEQHTEIRGSDDKKRLNTTTYQPKFETPTHARILVSAVPSCTRLLNGDVVQFSSARAG